MFCFVKIRKGKDINILLSVDEIKFINICRIKILLFFFLGVKEFVKFLFDFLKFIWSYVILCKCLGCIVNLREINVLSIFYD